METNNQPNQLALMEIRDRYLYWLCKREEKLAKSKKIFRHGVAAVHGKTVSVVKV